MTTRQPLETEKRTQELTTKINSQLGITITSLDDTFKRLKTPFARLFGKYAYADETPEIFKGLNYTHDDVAYAPSLMKTTRALKRRFINFWRKNKSAIMMLDIDRENVSPDIWASAGLPMPFLTNTNPAYGTCQIIYMMDTLVDKSEYYIIRDSMLKQLEAIGIKVDYSKPENMRSPFFDPFIGKTDRKRKRASIPYEKRGKVQADYTTVTVYDWIEYDPQDLYIKPADLNDVDWSSGAPQLPLIHTVQGRAKRAYNPAASTSLFDQLREACYPLYSKKHLWGFETVLAMARELSSGGGYSDKKINATAKGVFDWIEREFPKSHDPSKASGKGSLWARLRWSKARMKKECLVDFANKEGYSRQHASKLLKDCKLYQQFGHYFYSKNRLNDPMKYIESCHLNTNKESLHIINNKHVNQEYEDVLDFENMSVTEYMIEPPIPPPKVTMETRTRDLVKLWS